MALGYVFVFIKSRGRLGCTVQVFRNLKGLRFAKRKLAVECPEFCRQGKFHNWGSDDFKVVANKVKALGPSQKKIPQIAVQDEES